MNPGGCEIGAADRAFALRAAKARAPRSKLRRREPASARRPAPSNWHFVCNDDVHNRGAVERLNALAPFAAANTKG